MKLCLTTHQHKYGREFPLYIEMRALHRWQRDYEQYNRMVQALQSRYSEHILNPQSYRTYVDIRRQTRRIYIKTERDYTWLSLC